MTQQAPTPVRTRQVPMPEWLTRKDDSGGSWVVHEGRPERGDAWTNITKREMRVPTGNDPISRVVRAHEMVHTKVSPKIVYHDNRYRATLESIEVAEEFRVNTLVRLAGFDTDVLADGSEQRTGEIVAMNKAWNDGVRFMCAVADTKAATQFIKGVKKYDEEMALALTEVHKVLKKEMRRFIKRYGQKGLANTTPVDTWGEPHPKGFTFAVHFAQKLDTFLKFPSEIDGDVVDGEGELTMDAEEVKTTAKHGARGRFADLVELKLPKPRTVSGSLGRRRVASNIGTNPRRLSRLLTDPERRVFDRKVRGNGGLVLIDQSSSMSLSDKQLWSIIDSAPGSLIIGYSHKAGTKDEPNIWILADRGKVVETIPNRRGGNGVDGPALQFAAKLRRGDEPFIWICDGVVTDENDSPQVPHLMEECAKLVLRHKIHQVKTVEEAVDALKRVASGQRLGVKAVGNISRTTAWSKALARA